MSAARAGATSDSARTTNKTRVSVAISSADPVLDGLDHVAEITGGVPQRLAALRLADTVERAHHDLCRAAPRRRPRRRPLAKRVRTEVTAELRPTPCRPSIIRDLYFTDAVAAVEGDALEGDRPSSRQPGAGLGRGQERAHRHPRDRYRGLRRGPRLDAAAGSVGDAVAGFHPELLVRLVHH